MATYMEMAIGANIPREQAVGVVLGLVRDLVQQASIRKSLRDTCTKLLRVVDFSHLVVSQLREFVADATDRERAQLLEIARYLNALVKALDDSGRELRESGITSAVPVRGRLLLWRLARLAEEADDVAENAALGASAPLAELVSRELAAVGMGATE